MVALEPVEPLRVVSGSDQIRLRLLGERQEVLGVAAPQLMAVADSCRRSPAYSRIVSSIVNLGSSSVPSRRVRPLSVNEASPSTTARSSLWSPQTLSAASMVHPPVKAASRANRSCSAGSRRPIARVDRRAQRALALGRVPCPSPQQQQPAVEPLQQGRRWQRTDARLAELDRKRKPVERSADIRHGSRVRGGDREIRPDGARA